MLCIIPARGGSKRIPRKNIKPFLGKPIIEYPISIARAAGFDVIVSTEDQEISGVAIRAGVSVAHRPQYLAGDDVEIEAVLFDCLKGREGTACMMMPTSVFAKDVTEARELMEHHRLVYSIVRYEYPIQRALEINNGVVRLESGDNRNSQDIPVRYHDAGQFYMFDIQTFLDAWMHEQRLLEMPGYGIMYAPHEVQDIDTPEDWAIAEKKYKARGH